MPSIPLTLTEQEMVLVENYAKLHGKSLSEVFKIAFFEKLEDEYDLKLLKEYEKEEKVLKNFTLSEVKKELGF